MELKTIKVKRICAGEYRVIRKNPGRFGPDTVVRVYKVEHPNDGTYWIADPDWKMNSHSDPVCSKKRAVEVAKQMITDEVRASISAG